ncbi:hypothetical protein [Ovoidimarina sediminis]|uniref:hypothetical protein n=1 Tax=Ovoidimarina sediminis TaxID=3079856 RepID=UPI002908B207|nr:hypothetical protein [Rhodophyticola sp. MJ-SS7]MDU8942471.1 hypothetical protein [Rhodophyticola sp. MJ-SS7]
MELSVDGRRNSEIAPDVVQHANEAHLRDAMRGARNALDPAKPSRGGLLGRLFGSKGR